MKDILIILLIILVIINTVFLYCCMKISGEISEKEGDKK